MLSLSAETASRLFAKIAPTSGRPLVVAVSGGGDSLFLLLLLNLHFHPRGREEDLLAVTVDHGLREGSAAEAETIAALCRARGIPHRTMRWRGEKPRAGIATAARQARLALLATAARDVGAAAILVGHTLDDQAETVLMRQSRGTGRGLAGIAPESLVEGDVWIVRPLLNESRADIRAALRAEGVAWIDDPSNENLDWERIRIRRMLGGEAGQALRTDALATAREAARARVAAAEAAGSLIARAASMVAPGLFRLDPAFAEHVDVATAQLVLRVLIACAGGAEQLPDAARADALLARLHRPPFRATLGGAVVDARRTGAYFHRESRGGWTGRRPVVPAMVWDGRFRVGAEAGAASFVEALGLSRAAELAEATAEVPRALVRAALAAEPALSVDDGASTPTRLPPSQARRLPAPWARLLPGFDMALATALCRLIGADLPQPPWAGHNDA